MVKKTWIEVGRKSDEMIGFDYELERGIGLAGNSGTGKSNMITYILSQLLDKKDNLDIHIFHQKTRFMYKKMNDKFDNVLEMEGKLHKVRASLNRLCKEIDRRKRKLERHGMTVDEMRDYVKGSEIANWNEKLVVLDDFSIMLIKLREKDNKGQLEKLIELATKVVNEGPEVGIKSILVFLRNVNFDAPESIVNGLTVLGTTNNNLEDYTRWDLVIEGDKLPKKNGELLLKTRDFKGFVKTYEITKYVDNRVGIFSKWNPYINMYKNILKKLG